LHPRTSLPRAGCAPSKVRPLWFARPRDPSLRPSGISRPDCCKPCAKPNARTQNTQGIRTLLQ